MSRTLDGWKQAFADGLALSEKPCVISRNNKLQIVLATFQFGACIYFMFKVFTNRNAKWAGKLQYLQQGIEKFCPEVINHLVYFLNRCSYSVCAVIAPTNDVKNAVYLTKELYLTETVGRQPHDLY